MVCIVSMGGDFRVKLHWDDIEIYGELLNSYWKEGYWAYNEFASVEFSDKVLNKATCYRVIEFTDVNHPSAKAAYVMSRRLKSQMG